MKSVLTVLLALLLLGGCSLRPEAKPPITYYYLQPEIEALCTPLQSKKLLQLSFVDALPSLLGKNIIYKKPDLKTGSYLYSKWNQSPRYAIMSSLYTALKEQQHYREILYNSRLESDLTLEIKVMQFEHRFTQTDDSYALVGLDAVLYDTQSRSVRSSRFFSSQTRAASNDAPGGVKAINDALGKVLSELLCWSEEQGGME